jgi:hypothetical protein
MIAVSNLIEEGEKIVEFSDTNYSFNQRKNSENYKEEKKLERPKLKEKYYNE